MDLSFLEGVLAGGLIGTLLGQVVTYLINKGVVEKVTEEAEMVIPDQFEKPLSRIFDAIAKELADTNNENE